MQTSSRVAPDGSFLIGRNPSTMRSPFRRAFTLSPSGSVTVTITRTMSTSLNEARAGRLVVTIGGWLVGKVAGRVRPRASVIPHAVPITRRTIRA